MANFNLNLFYVVFPDCEYNVALVGSRAQNKHTIVSDWDYMLNQNNGQREYIIQQLNEKGISYITNELNGSIKFSIELEGFGNQIINVLFVEDSDTYDAWIKATEVIKHLPRKSLTKKQRINFFCELVVMFGGKPSRYPNFCS